MTGNEERRRFTRVNFDTNATLIQQEENTVVRVLDISLNGVLVETPQEYRINTDLPLELLLALSEEDAIRMKVVLIHSSHDILGFKCESIDMESITLLRRLIELNMGDPHASERVLDELLHKE